MQWLMACNKLVCFYFCFDAISNLFVVGRWQARWFKFAFLYKLIITHAIHPADNIRQWLAAPDNSRNLNKARDKRQVNTCAWFLEGERFRVWQENPGFLWFRGRHKFSVHQFWICMFNVHSGMRENHSVVSHLYLRGLILVEINPLSSQFFDHR